jgi:hypothetical protein
VTVSAAELLMRTLYQQIFVGSDLSVAIRAARSELYQRKRIDSRKIGSPPFLVNLLACF